MTHSSKSDKIKASRKASIFQGVITKDEETSDGDHDECRGGCFLHGHDDWRSHEADAFGDGHAFDDDDECYAYAYAFDDAYAFDNECYAYGSDMAWAFACARFVSCVAQRSREECARARGAHSARQADFLCRAMVSLLPCDRANFNATSLVATLYDRGGCL